MNVTIEINWWLEPEHIPIEGNVQDSGDKEDDREQEEWVRDQLANGNEAAWAFASVHIVCDIDNQGAKPFPYHFVGRMTVGGMSWPSERQLWKDNLHGFASEAFDDLITNIQKFISGKGSQMGPGEVEIIAVAMDWLLENEEKILRDELPRWAWPKENQ